jgi:hypothetical protein
MLVADGTARTFLSEPAMPPDTAAVTPVTLPSSTHHRASSLAEATLTAAAEYYSENAQRCFRLARGVTDPAVIDTLERLGREYESAARRLWRWG